MFVARVDLCYIIFRVNSRTSGTVDYTYNISEATPFPSVSALKATLDELLPSKQAYEVVDLHEATVVTMDKQHIGPETKAVADGLSAVGLDADDNNLAYVVSCWAKKLGRRAEAQAVQSAIFDLQKHLAALKRNL